MRVTTAGESHGKAMLAILEGIPAGLVLDRSEIDRELWRRQGGYGRGARQNIEHDCVEFLSGVRNLVTLGSPIALLIPNRDYPNWKDCMAPEGCDVTKNRLTRVRPGHADLPGMKKFGTEDARNVLERASARETCPRVAAGGVCRALLRRLGVKVSGFVRAIGSVRFDGDVPFDEIESRRTELGMVDADTERQARSLIERAKREGDTLGGRIELRIKGLKSGFGSCMTARERLNARLCAALMSVPAIKGVEIGLGFEAAERRGSEAQDELFWRDGKICRMSNFAGGIEGGMSNGEEIVLRAAMKPLPTLARGLRSVDLATGEEAVGANERSDVCAVGACEVALEAALLLELCAVVLERLGGDTMTEVEERYAKL